MTTTAGGAYTAGGLPPRTYFVVALPGSNMNYLSELWDNLPCCNFSDGTPIELTAGATRSGIDFALARGGIISGRVTDELAGTGLERWIGIYTAGAYLVKSVLAASDGRYSVVGLPSGSYLASTFSLTRDDPQNYVDEIWDNIPCLAIYNGCPVTTGTPISVAADATHAGIDFALSHGGIITGRITDAATGAGLAGIEVAVFTSTGIFVGSQLSSSTGSYAVAGLPAGTYYARTFVAVH